MTTSTAARVLHGGFGPPGLAAALLLLVILGARCAGPEPRPDQPEPAAERGAVRVLLAKHRGARSIEVTGPEKIRVRIGEAERIVAAPVNVTFFPNHELRVNGEPGGAAAVELSPAAPGSLVLGGRRYRGVLAVSLDGEGRCSAVNHVSLPHYLRGVVGGEMPSHWPLEALKAQTVAARTYVVARMLGRRESLFHVYDDTRSQVYVGVPTTGAKAIGRAVDETAGLVLTYEGRILTAYFHSTCGGRTENGTDGFDEKPIPPFKGVACDGCKESRYYRWTADLTGKDVGEALGFGPVTGLAVTAATRGGRVRSLAVTHGSGKSTVAGTRFRMKVGPGRVRSTAFAVKKAEGGFRLSGRGWGHGVGLCQWGARGHALGGADFKAIVTHYYPEARLKTVTELPSWQ